MAMLPAVQDFVHTMRALYEEVGGFGTLLSITADSDDASWDHESLTLLAEEVGPRIKDLG